MRYRNQPLFYWILVRRGGQLQKALAVSELLVDGNPLEDITVIGGTDAWFDADPEYKLIPTLHLVYWFTDSGRPRKGMFVIESGRRCRRAPTKDRRLPMGLLGLVGIELREYARQVPETQAWCGQWGLKEGQGLHE